MCDKVCDKLKNNTQDSSISLIYRYLELKLICVINV